jgi:Holliday junction resolvasome RuvABC ATP-dependent DNA helicase subunit
VGQAGPKKELSFYLESYQKTRYMPPLGIIAPKGQGKTKIARAIAKGLFKFDSNGEYIYKQNGDISVPVRKDFYEINCSSIKNLKSFFNSVLIPLVVDKDVTIFFDEASEIPRDVSMALLSILENNASKKTTLTVDEYTCEFDLRRQSFIFCTSEGHKMFHALADRLEKISLEEYTYDDLSKIVSFHLEGIEIENFILKDISSVLRGNARAAIKMADKIKMYLVNKKQFVLEDWTNLKSILSIHPLGINNAEINILRHLYQTPKGISLTCLAAKTGISREALRLDCELYLLKHGLISIESSGRQITGKGAEILKEIS